VPPNHVYFVHYMPRMDLFSLAPKALMAALESPFFRTLSVNMHDISIRSPYTGCVPVL
jgi:hypothetical protein